MHPAKVVERKIDGDHVTMVFDYLKPSDHPFYAEVNGGLTPQDSKPPKKWGQILGQTWVNYLPKAQQNCDL